MVTPYIALQPLPLLMVWTVNQLPLSENKLRWQNHPLHQMCLWIPGLIGCTCTGVIGRWTLMIIQCHCYTFTETRISGGTSKREVFWVEYEEEGGEQGEKEKGTGNKSREGTYYTMLLVSSYVHWPRTQAVCDERPGYKAICSQAFPHCLWYTNLTQLCLFWLFVIGGKEYETQAESSRGIHNMAEENKLHSKWPRPVSVLYTVI